MKPIGGHWEEEFGKFDEDGYLLRRSHLPMWSDIRSNHPDGHGTIDFIDQSMEESTGGKYEGEISQGVPHGYGEVTYLSGTKYKGMFWDGWYQGQGTIYFPDGRKVEGIFCYDHPYTVNYLDENGNTTKMIVEEELFKGEFKNHKPWNVPRYDGSPVRPQNLIGQYIKGEWIEGIPDGMGIKNIYDNDSRELRLIIGEFKNGKPWKCFQLFRFEDSKSRRFFIIEGKFENGDYEEGIQNEENTSVSFSDGFKYEGFYYKTKGLEYDEFDSYGKKTGLIVSRRLLEEKIENPIFDKCKGESE